MKLVAIVLLLTLIILTITVWTLTENFRSERHCITYGKYTPGITTEYRWEDGCIVTENGTEYTYDNYINMRNRRLTSE